jgi:hypothetical protein
MVRPAAFSRAKPGSLDKIRKCVDAMEVDLVVSWYVGGKIRI